MENKQQNITELKKIITFHWALIIGIYDAKTIKWTWKIQSMARKWNTLDEYETVGKISSTRISILALHALLPPRPPPQNNRKSIYFIIFASVSYLIPFSLTQ